MPVRVFGGPADEGTLSLSGYGWELVSDLAKWMRIVSGFLFVFGALMLVVGFGFLACASRFSNSTAGLATMGGAFVYGVLLFFGGTWLRGAATHFYEGVMGDATSPLAQGFRKLRLYLILYGVANLVGLGISIFQLVVK